MDEVASILGAKEAEDLEDTTKDGRTRSRIRRERLQSDLHNGDE
jgi:hypothetical protein